VSRLALVAKNSLFLILDRCIRGFLLMFLTIVIARVLAVETFGVYALAITISGIFRVVADFGTTFLTTHEIAKQRSQVSTLFVHGLVLKLIISAVGMIVLVGMSHIFYPGHVRLALYIGGAAAVLRLLVEFVTAFFGGHEKMNYVSYVMMIYMILVFLIIGVMLLMGVRSPAGLISGYVFGGLITLPIATSILFSKIEIKFVSIKWREMRRIFILAIPFGLYFISDIIYFHTDILMLSVMRGEHSVGLYQSAMKINQLLEAFPLLIVSALFPTISRIYAQSKTEIHRMLEKSLGFIIILSVPLSVGAVLLADGLIVAIYGSKYADSGDIFRILSMMIPFRFIGFIVGMALTATGGQTKRLIVVAITAGLNVLLNSLWIPMAGVQGAAWASVVSAVVLTVCFIVFARSLWPIGKSRGVIVKVMLASGIMGGIVYVLRPMISLWLVIAIGVAVYGVLIVLMKAFSREDWQQVRALISKKEIVQ